MKKVIGNDVMKLKNVENAIDSVREVMLYEESEVVNEKGDNVKKVIGDDVMKSKNVENVIGGFVMKLNYVNVEVGDGEIGVVNVNNFVVPVVPNLGTKKYVVMVEDVKKFIGDEVEECGEC